MPSSYISLWYHIVFSTKGRMPVLDAVLRERLFPYFGGIVRSERGLLKAVGGTFDHVHLLLSLPQDRSVMDIARVVKANSSRWIHESFPAQRGFEWQRGYGAFSVSRGDVDRLESYVLGQEEHHRARSFQEEFVGFLREMGISFDERYLFQ